MPNDPPVEIVSGADDTSVVASGDVEFALLGPLEVRRDGQPLALRRGRSRSLLTVLLLRLGRAIPADVLVQQLWGAHPPADAANALHVQICYLRRALQLPARGPAPALRTVAGGYQMDLDADRVDLFRFERAVSAVAERPPDPSGCQAGDALIEIRAALGLWRGEPLQDAMYQLDVAADIDRLLELRTMAQEHEIQALLEPGPPR